MSVVCFDKRQWDKVGHCILKAIHLILEVTFPTCRPVILHKDKSRVAVLTFLLRSLSSVKESHLLATDFNMFECVNLLFSLSLWNMLSHGD